MPEKKCPPPGAPEWVLTYGDMMSLLLTFFIMLFAMSSLEKVKTAAVSESLSSQFGYASTQVPTPGQQPPANSNRTQIRSTGRAKRMDTLSGGNPVMSPKGDYSRVRTIRPSRDNVQGGVIYFQVGSDELTDQTKEDMRTIAEQLRGSPYMVSIVGHTAIEEKGPYTDMFSLGFARANAVRKALIELGLNGKSISTTSVGPTQPVPVSLTATGRTSQQSNAFVEVYRLLEEAKEFEGERSERESTNSPGTQ